MGVRYQLCCLDDRVYAARMAGRGASAGQRGVRVHGGHLAAGRGASGLPAARGAAPVSGGAGRHGQVPHQGVRRGRARGLPHGADRAGWRAAAARDRYGAGRLPQGGGAAGRRRAGGGAGRAGPARGGVLGEAAGQAGGQVATRRPYREIMVPTELGAAAGLGQREGSGPVSRQARILLVDDRPENLVALEAILSSLNQILVPVRSGEQAIAAVLAEGFAVVLLDIMMPGMDGFETATQIKRHAKSRDVPIIFLTAATMQPEQAFRGYAAGAVDYLAKPFDPWVLKSKVSVFVDLYLKRSASALDHLSAGLGAVEETVALLRKLPAVLRDAEAKEAAAQLAGRVGRLRDALERFGSGAA